MDDDFVLFYTTAAVKSWVLVSTEDLTGSNIQEI